MSVYPPAYYQPIQGTFNDVRVESSIATQLCGEEAIAPGGLFYSQSMDLSNDPRFFEGNVIDKRLTAFTALSMISSLMAGAACDQFFPYLEADDMKVFGRKTWWDIERTTIQFGGFVLMCCVLFMNVIATLVFGVQFYYTFRLMTSGPIGFETARSFYMDPKMTYRRHQAALSLIIGLPMFVVATGCMIYVKLDTIENKHPYLHHYMSWVGLWLFLIAAGITLKIGLDHQRIFVRKYSAETYVQPLLNTVNAC